MYLRTALLITSFTLASAALADAPVYDIDNYPPVVNSRAPAQSAAVTQGNNDNDTDYYSDEDIAADNTPSSAAAAPTVTTTMPPTAGLTESQRLSRIEQQIVNMQQTNNATRMDAMQAEVQTLRGRVDDLTHQLQQAQAAQKTMYSDLDSRVTALGKQTKEVKVITHRPGLLSPKTARKSTSSAATSDTGSTVATATASQPNVAEEQQTYQTAINLVQANKYSDAIGVLQKMLQKYPAGQFAANAHYWLGELYGLQGKPDQSAHEFQTVVSQYPDSPMLPNAQLKLGIAYAATQKWSAARAAFKKVIDNYPDSSSAHLASEQLKQLRVAGH